MPLARFADSDYSQRTKSRLIATMPHMGKDLKATIGRVLRTQREKLGISQEEVAERAGVDRSYVSILERGLKSPTLETLEKICAALGTLPERVIANARRG